MIKVQNLSFQYRKDLPLLLNDLSFDVNQGTVLTILGKNGVGKTTFLRCLTGELSSYTGNIYIDQKEVRDYSLLSESLSCRFSGNWICKSTSLTSVPQQTAICAGLGCAD